MNSKCIKKIFSIVCDLSYNTKNSLIKINSSDEVIEEIPQPIIGNIHSERDRFNVDIIKILIHFFMLSDETGNIMLYKKSLNEAFYSQKERDQLFLKINQQLQLESNPIEKYDDLNMAIEVDAGLFTLFLECYSSYLHVFFYQDRENNSDLIPIMQLPKFVVMVKNLIVSLHTKIANSPNLDQNVNYQLFEFFYTKGADVLRS